MSFSSLCIFWKKLSLILCLNELIPFVDFKSADSLRPHIGQALLASARYAVDFLQWWYLPHLPRIDIDCECGI